MTERVEWVEIIEPRSGEHMFANLKTGQCLWEPPAGTKVKKTNDNQWWELYDPNTRRYYYYNATTQKTVWRKPKDGDIIPLAKLQQIKARESSRKLSEDSSRGSSRKGRSGSKTSGSGDMIGASSRVLPKYENVDISVNMKNDLRLIDNTDGDNDIKFVPLSEPMKRKVSRSSSLGEPDSLTFARGPSKSKSMKEGYRHKLSTKDDSPMFTKTPGGGAPNRAPPKPPRQTAGSGSTGNDVLDGKKGDAIADEMHLYDTPEEMERIHPEQMETDENGQKWEIHMNGSSLNNKSKTIERPTRPAPAVPVVFDSPLTTRTIDGRRRLPDLEIVSQRPQLKKSQSLKQTPVSPPWSDTKPKPEPIDLDIGRDTPKSPFSQMMAEVEEYNKANPSPSGMITETTDEERPPETPSPSGTLLPQNSRPHYISVYDNLEGEQKHSERKQDKSMKMPYQNHSPGSEDENSYAERLISMGMPISTAALVDACDPVAITPSPREGAVSRTESDKATLTRMKSDSSVIMKRPETPDKGLLNESTLSHRPTSMLSVSTKPKEFTLRWTARGSTSSEPSNLNEKVPLSTHRKGILRKRVSIHSMLSWSKVPIKKPMVLTRDKQVRKEAVDVFKLILQFMGDKSSRKSTQGLGLEIVTKGWTMKGLRDEIYIQLCKQTTTNEKSTSLQRGWELLAICLAIFPPSVKFHSYLEGYIYRHLEPEDDELGVPVSSYAKHCYKQLERICQSGAKKGQKKPTVEEMEAAKNAVFNPSLFGNSLEDIMEMQTSHYPKRKLPWILPTLSGAVLDQGGLQTEGIFRVPGDIDEVNSLKVLIDKWQEPAKLHDPHVPASLLKLWFRELYDPLIPNSFYENCINNCENSTVAISIICSLPEINKLVLSFLIRFLQMFMASDVAAMTKMDASNLAMVWAPNCLRCPSDDPMEIFENTRKEMTFLRTLMTSYDTSFLEGVL